MFLQKNISLVEFKTDDYYDADNGPELILHHCKIGLVSVLDANYNPNENVGIEVLALLEE